MPQSPLEPDRAAQLLSEKLSVGHANRHAWSLEMYGHLLAEALRKDTSAEARKVEKLNQSQIPAHLVTIILEKADPTQNKGMTAWLVGQYAQGKLRLEDLGTANETLTMFRGYGQRLEHTQRDLGQYPSLAAVWEAVIGFANAEEQQISSKAQKALDRDKAYEESRILRQDPDGFTIAVPLTEFAAKWWGRGTRWCTSAERDNRFWQYHKDAPLIVVVIPELKEKGKFQLWITEGSGQFMDGADQRPPKDRVAEYWPRFERLMLHAVAQNGHALKWVPENLRTDEMCRIAVAENGGALEHVPQKLCTDEMCRIAVAEDGRALYYVSEKLRTDEMCRIAVARDGESLYYVPEALRTEEVCKIAIAQAGAQNGLALHYVPEKLRTNEMCRIAVSQNGEALGSVPRCLRTADLCRIAVAKNGLALGYVPQKLHTEEMYEIAVAQNGLALEYVPKKLRTEEMCRIAVAKDGGALYYVSEKLRTDEMCRIAVAQNGRALEYVPEKLRTEEIYRLAVAQNGRILQHVPESLRTEEMCKIALSQNDQALVYVPEALLDRIKALIPSPVQTWDISLLDELVSLLGSASSPPPSGQYYA
jgi:hypothetical protein